MLKCKCGKQATKGSMQDKVYCDDCFFEKFKSEEDYRKKIFGK